MCNFYLRIAYLLNTFSLIQVNTISSFFLCYFLYCFANEQWAAPRTRMKIKNRGHSERAWSLAFVRLPATVKGPGYTTTFWVFKQVSLYYNTYFVAEFYQHYFLKWPRLAKGSILFSQTCNMHMSFTAWRLTMLTKFHFKFPAHDMILHVTRFCTNVLCAFLELWYCWWDYRNS